MGCGLGGEFPQLALGVFDGVGCDRKPVGRSAIATDARSNKYPPATPSLPATNFHTAAPVPAKPPHSFAARVSKWVDGMSFEF